MRLNPGPVFHLVQVGGERVTILTILTWASLESDDDVVEGTMEVVTAWGEI
jgi:hypothetical protein